MSGYFKNHPDYQNELDYTQSYNKLSSDLNGQKIKIQKNDKVFEIGYGKGSFANFCNLQGIQSYTGIDIDDYYKNFLKDKFNNYIFTKNDISTYFLENKQNKYNVIFTSHVFEHLSDDDINSLIKGIYNSLEKGGIWINYMPNADSVFNSTSMRYCDITHISLYNHVSFEQKINQIDNIKFKIRHYNDRATSLLRRIIHLPFKYLFKLFYLGMMQNMPKYYTSNLISVLKKED